MSYAEQLGRHAELVWSFRMQDEGERRSMTFATKHIDGLKR
jgi:hypothetical protein